MTDTQDVLTQLYESLERQQELISGLRRSRSRVRATVVGLVLAVVGALAQGATTWRNTQDIERLVSITSAADCAIRRDGREAAKEAILDAALASGEALIETANAGRSSPVVQEVVDLYRAEIVAKVGAQLEETLPPIRCP